MAPILHLVPPQVPPVGLLERVEAELDRFDAISVAPSPMSWWRSMLLLPTGLAGAAAGAAGLALVVLPQAPTVCPAARIAMLQVETASAGIGVDSIECGKYLRLSHAGMNSTGTHTLELWFIPQGGTPQSLGLVAAKGSTTVLPVPVALMKGDALALSREPVSGSPSNEPSGPVLVIAAIGRAG